MATKRQAGQYELVLENRQLVFIFFGAVVLCAVFFALGFLVGREQRDWGWRASTENPETTGKKSSSPSTTPAKKEVTPSAAKDGKAVDQDAISKELTFFKTVEGQSKTSDYKVNPSPAGKSRENEKGDSSRSKEAAEANSKPAPAVAPHPSFATTLLFQVAALSKKLEAETLVRKLKEKGFQAFVVSPPADSAVDKLYRVQVGPFTDSRVAEQVKNKLVASGYPPLVKK